MTGGSPITMPEVEELADAILFVWYPGQEGGAAVGDVLFGDVSPSGRLPVTFPRTVEQLPPYEDYSMKGRTYKYMTDSPLFPFGYGLSYTTFEYSNALLQEKDGLLSISVDIKNSGTVKGDEVVQLYVSSPLAGNDAPFSSLSGMKRINLEKGETKKITFTLKRSDLAIVNEKGQKYLPKGQYTISVSAAAPCARSNELGIARTDLKYTVN
jgi:beta-glucosidase